MTSKTKSRRKVIFCRASFIFFLCILKSCFFCVWYIFRNIMHYETPKLGQTTTETTLFSYMAKLSLDKIKQLGRKVFMLLFEYNKILSNLKTITRSSRPNAKVYLNTYLALEIFTFFYW